MTDEVLIKVEGVSKKFCSDLKRSLWYGVKDISAGILGMAPNGELREKEFWAVNDVGFELSRGECLGLIGHNGAGKSTLLKMLNGLIKPDKGMITMKGRIGALIELGAGFNPILTGRENIYNNGAVLGFSKKDIDKKFDAIVDFAEIPEFIDTPVQNYSSGMKVRLGFAVAAQMEPDVLIIDEVLAVGDVGFKIKCFNAISEMAKNSAIIFVSHSMPQVARVCNKLVLLHGGKDVYNGNNVPQGIELYYGSFRIGPQKKVGAGVDLKKVIINDCDSDEVTVNYSEDLNILLEISLISEVKHLKIEMVFFDIELKPIASCFSQIFEARQINSEVSLTIPKVQFSSGTYSMTFNFFSCSFQNGRTNYEILAKYESIKEFKVKGANMMSYAAIQFLSEWRYK